MDNINVSVIICTRNRPIEMNECVRTLTQQTLLPEELIVVDSSDEIGLEEDLKRIILGYRITFKYLHCDPGLALQRNRGIEVSRGSVIIFLDDDTLLDSDYIITLWRIFDKDRKNNIAGIQGSFVEANKMTKYSYVFRRLFLLPGATGKGKMQASGFPSYIKRPNRLIEVEMICGGNTAYRRGIIEEFKWDEKYFGYSYMEDDDFSYRVSRKYKLMQTPDAKLIHNHSKKSRDDVYKSISMEVRNHAMFFLANMPKRVKNIIAYIWSEIGCSIITFRKYGILGIKIRLRAYVKGIRNLSL